MVKKHSHNLKELVKKISRAAKNKKSAPPRGDNGIASYIISNETPDNDKPSRRRQPEHRG